jgi:cytochrome c oxidase subunit 2
MVTPDKIGNYYGQCVELCGASHSNMRFRVKVVSQEVYDKWIAGAKAYSAASNPQFAQGEALFKANCQACHGLKGVSQGLPANPDLTFFGNRTTVGAGMWENKPEYLERWIKNSPGMKPGIKMPAYPQLSDDDVKAIAGYLLSHKVDGLDLSNLPKY